MHLDRRDILKIAGCAAASLAGGIIESGRAADAAAAPQTELSSFDATGLAELIRSKQITAAEAVEDAIRKIEAINPRLNAIVCKTYEGARQRLAAGVGDGPF